MNPIIFFSVYAYVIGGTDLTQTIMFWQCSPFNLELQLL